VLFTFFASIDLFVLLLVLPFLYFFIDGLKLAIRSKKMSGILYGPLIALIKRVAYVLGVSFGK
jgi:hypothetical protein